MFVWAAGAAGFQWLVDRPHRHFLGIFGWAAMDVVLFTALLWIKDGPSSSLAGGYLLLIAVAALRFRTRLVWFVTELSLASYTVLVADAYWRQPNKAPTSPQTPLVFALALLLMGLAMTLLLRRGRAAQTAG
jgi:hypothetical protein